MYKCQDCGFNAPEHCEHVELQAEIHRLIGIADRANKAMEKHMKHNAAMEIAIQEAHRDTDKANLQNRELVEALLHMKSCGSCCEDSWEDCEGGCAALAALEKANPEKRIGARDCADCVLAGGVCDIHWNDQAEAKTGGICGWTCTVIGCEAHRIVKQKRQGTYWCIRCSLLVPENVPCPKCGSK